MAKNLNEYSVKLSFTADTAKAKSELQSLQQQLKTIVTGSASTNSLGISQELKEASQEAVKLQVALKKATTSTGTLDLAAFKKELGKVGTDISKVSQSLMNLGPAGQTAFNQLVSSVNSAEVSIKRTNGLLTEFATTLKNTARWQLSSSVLHGFMGAVQSAYGYAKDLNESLNDIRIVTGQSKDQMADFAIQANKAAKELGATTLAYTDAALIFYQAGLSGDDVTERADAVIKMSNVTGEAAEDVSSYMTAIWNNFADGSKELEYYADVLTALGASTASSTAEIAAGLEKFAAIGETVGLSYEYATSALATVVAETRQSADVVGTAFRTLFARLQGLKLGETLEDGVNLNKYSQALNAVGVQVLDATGNMKDMDVILDELADKWGNLSSAQQTALAQTVAGKLLRIA